MKKKKKKKLILEQRNRAYLSGDSVAFCFVFTLRQIPIIIKIKSNLNFSFFNEPKKENSKKVKYKNVFFFFSPFFTVLGVLPNYRKMLTFMISSNNNMKNASF